MKTSPFVYWAVDRMNHTEEQRSRLITIIKVKELNPCDDRFNNFTKEYPNYSGTLREFLKLDKISYVEIGRAHV